MSVSFHEPSHTYTSHTGEKYTSVTTLIKKYTPVFDEDFWSAYKAIQAVLTEKGVWDKFKREVGGWENVVTAARIDKSFPYKKEVSAKKKAILVDWEATRQDAASKGTGFHKLREGTVNEGKIFIYDSLEVPVKSGADLFSNRKHNTGDGLHTELLVYNHDWQLAGQADWVLIVGDEVHIRDYKTSKKIETKAFQDEVLLTPLGHLPNCNFYTYSLQLSIYGYMLEQIGLTVASLTLEHVDRETYNPIADYSVKYLRNEAKELIEHFCATKRKEILRF